MFASLSLMTLLLAAPPAGKAEKPIDPAAALILVDQRIAAKDLDGAERVLQRLAKEEPAAAGIYLKRGEIAEARKQPRQAFLDYQHELLRMGGERPTGEAAARRSAALLDAPGADAKAILMVMQQAAGPAKSLEQVRALRKKGDHFVLRVLEAEMAEAVGEAGSEARFRALVKDDPAFVPARLGLARALEAAGKKADAEKELLTARQIDPHHWALQP